MISWSDECPPTADCLFDHEGGEPRSYLDDPAGRVVLDHGVKKLGIDRFVRLIVLVPPGVLQRGGIEGGDVPCERFLEKRKASVYVDLDSGSR